jgi:hypothetical protein
LQALSILKSSKNTNYTDNYFTYLIKSSREQLMPSIYFFAK